MTVRCYIEEYTLDGGGLGLRLREKETSRKVEILAFTQEERDAFLAFLVALASTRDAFPNLYEPNGFDDFVVIDGNAEVDEPELIQFTHDSSLSYLIG